MRHLIWTDKNGYKHRMLCKDTDGQKEAQFGIKQDPPMITDAAWSDLRRDVHNFMVDNGLFKFQDYVKNQQVAMALLNMMKRFVVAQLKQE